MWVPVESVNSFQGLGAMLLEPSDILPDHHGLTPGSQSTLEPIIKQSLDANGDLTGDLQLIVMISLSEATTPVLETSSKLSELASTRFCGKKSRPAYLKLLDDTQLKQLDTFEQSTDGGE